MNMMSLKESARRRQGLTLVELAVVLGAMGFVMGAIWSVSSMVWDSYQLRELKQQIVTVVQNTRAYYDVMGSLKGSAGIEYPNNTDITKDLDQDDRHIIPVEMRLTPDTAGGAINHALAVDAAGTFFVESRSTGRRFRIRLLNIKRSQCFKLLMEFPFLTPEIGVTQVEVNGTIRNINTNNPVSPGLGFPMTLPVAQNLCNSAPPNLNEVDIVFKLKN